MKKISAICVICGDAWEKQELHRLCEDCIEKYGVRADNPSSLCSEIRAEALGDSYPESLLRRAADEIERLRAEVKKAYADGQWSVMND